MVLDKMANEKLKVFITFSYTLQRQISIKVYIQEQGNIILERHEYFH